MNDDERILKMKEVYAVGTIIFNNELNNYFSKKNIKMHQNNWMNIYKMTLIITKLLI